MKRSLSCCSDASKDLDLELDYRQPGNPTKVMTLNLNTHTLCRWSWASPSSHQPGSGRWGCDAGRSLRSTGSGPLHGCRNATFADLSNGRSPLQAGFRTALQKITKLNSYRWTLKDISCLFHINLVHKGQMNLSMSNPSWWNTLSMLLITNMHKK